MLLCIPKVESSWNHQIRLRNTEMCRIFITTDDGWNTVYVHLPTRRLGLSDTPVRDNLMTGQSFSINHFAIHCETLDIRLPLTHHF